MTIQEMRDKKKEMGYTYAQIADLSGVPLGTVQKIFSGETESPRYDTILALEQLFRDIPVVRESSSYKSGSRYERNGSYTLDDYYALPDEHFRAPVHRRGDSPPDCQLYNGARRKLQTVHRTGGCTVRLR